MKETVKGSLFIIFAFSLFAMQVLFVRFIKINELSLIAYFQLFFLIAMFIVNNKVYGKEQFKLRHNLKKIIFSSIFIFGMMVFYYLSIRSTTLANASLMRNTAPIFAFLFAIVFLKEKFSLRNFGVLLMSIVGILFIFYTKNFSIDLGVVYGLAAGICLGSVFSFNKSMVSKGNFISMMFFQTLFVTAFSVPFLFTEFPTFGQLGLIALFTVIFAFVPTIMHNYGLSKVRLQHAGIMNYLEVVIIAMFGWIIFGEILGLNTWIGGILIIISGIIIIYFEAKEN